ncbi:hypothetical protein B0H10DRAFT_1960124 [Mycena sp. CBHHK59/15]|nr:hypothetical protein B0H10DRAFT_1960124 [Mycena sp. CBHHK59/15]
MRVLHIAIHCCPLARAWLVRGFGLAVQVSGRSAKAADNGADYSEEEEVEEEEEQVVEEKEEEDDDDEAELELEFLIPVDSAADELIMSSTIAPSNTWTVETLPRKLETLVHMVQLFSNARKELVDQAKSKSKKMFQVEIMNLEAKSSSKNEKKSDKKGKAKASISIRYVLKSAHKKKSESSNSEEGDGLPKKKSEGVHKLVSEAPNPLGLPTEMGMKAAAPTHCTQKLPPAAPYPPTLLSTLTWTVWTAVLSTARTHTCSCSHSASTAAPTITSTITSMCKEDWVAPRTSLESQGDDSPMLYPTIDDWLLDLNTSDCREGGHQFNSFGVALHANGFICLEQLADEGKGGSFLLHEICEDKTIGVSKLLVKYVIKDCKKLWKDVRKQKAEWEAN